MIHLYPIGFNQTATAATIIAEIENLLGKDKISILPQAIDRAAFFEQYLYSKEHSTAIVLLLGPQTAYWNQGLFQHDWKWRLSKAKKCPEFVVLVEEKVEILPEADLERFLAYELDFNVDYIVRQSSNWDVFSLYMQLHACFPNHKSPEERIQFALKWKHSFLDLSHCHLNQLPASFIELAPNLERLNLEANEFEYIPREITLCNTLGVLNFANNPLNRATGLARLKNLKVLNLRNTLLHDFPNEVIECFQLEQLDLSNNNISGISAGIGNLQNLERLNIIGNQLNELPEQLAEMPNLKDVLLKGNPLRTPPLEVALRGVSAIQAYFDDLTQGRNQSKGQNWLLTVAIDQYADHTHNRPNTLHFTQELIQVLQDKYDYTSARTLINAEATEQQVIAAMQHLSSLCSLNDSLILYFSIRTEQLPQQESALNFYDRALSFSQLARPLNGFRAKHILVIIDDFFYSPLIEGYRSTKGLAEQFSSRWILYNQQGGSDYFTPQLLDFLRANTKEIGVSELAYQLPQTNARPIFLSGDEGGNFSFVPSPQTTAPHQNTEVANKQLEQLKNQIKNQIAKAQIDQSLKALEKAIVPSTSTQNDLVLLQSRWSRLQREVRMGVLSNQDESIESNRIIDSLLAFVNDLDVENLTLDNSGNNPIDEELDPTTQKITDLIQQIERWRKELVISSSTRERRKIKGDLKVALAKLEAITVESTQSSKPEDKLAKAMLTEERQWTEALQVNTVSAFEIYLRNHPNSIYSAEASQKISELRQQNQEAEVVENIRKSPNLSAINAYFNSFPNGKYRLEIQTLKQKLEQDEEELWDKVKQGNNPAAYKDYLNQTLLGYYEHEAKQLIDLLENKKELLVNEAKLIIIGNGRVGKTSLAKVLTGEKFDPNENSTHGVKIREWKLPCGNDLTLNLNIWDFGGQERYHNTHSFFLNKRALYLLVWDKDTETDAVQNPNPVDIEQQNFDYNYWLNTIKTRGENSPVIMTQNKIEAGEVQLNQGDITALYKNVCAFEEVSAAKRINLDRLQESIVEQYQQAPALKNLIPFVMPLSQQEARAELKKLCNTEGKPYISIEAYEAICEKHQLASAKEFGTYLHDIGSILFFPEGKGRLKDIVILNPIWATEIIYKVINDTVKSKHGYFTKAELIVKAEDQHEDLAKKDARKKGLIFKDYKEVEIFLELMLSFEICFELTFTPDTYIMPQYLPLEKPEMVKNWSNQGCRRFGFEYAYLPRSVIARGIARMGKYALGNKHWWRDGLLIKHKENLALIEVDYGKKRIEIAIRGENMEKLEDWILEEQFAELNLQLPATLVRFCPHCGTSIAEEAIQRRKKQGKPTLECQNPACEKTIPIEDFYPKSIKKQAKIFISYANLDAEWQKKLKKAIVTLEYHPQYPATVFDDTQLRGGQDINETLLTEQLHQADIVIFLVSANFISSKYCREKEVPQAMEQLEHNKSSVLPIILEPMYGYDALPYHHIASSPAKLKSIQEFIDEKKEVDAWKMVYTDLLALVKAYYEA